MTDAPERYASVRAAILLKEKGFATSCMTCFDASDNYKLTWNHAFPWDEKHKEFLIIAPTQQMAAAWIRLNFNIFIEVYRVLTGFYTYRLIKFDNNVTELLYDPMLDSSCDNYSWDEPEDACDAALENTLENFIK